MMAALGLHVAVEDCRDLFDLFLIELCCAAKLCRQQTVDLAGWAAMRQLDEANPLASNSQPLIRIGIFTERFCGLLRRTVFIRQIFMEVTAQKGAEGSEVCRRDFARILMGHLTALRI